MNPKLIKFTVELQNNAVSEDKEQKTIYFSNKFFNFFKPAKVTVPIKKD